MALGDLMVSRFSHSSSAVSNHLVECTNHQEDVDRNVRENNSIRDSDTASSSYGHSTAVTVTSMAYLPQTILLCELRHEAFEGCVPSGPSDSGLVSKWRPRDRKPILSLQRSFVSQTEAILVCNSRLKHQVLEEEA